MLRSIVIQRNALHLRAIQSSIRFFTGAKATEEKKQSESIYEHEEGKSKRGFAAMPHEQVVEIARKGGQHSHTGKGKEADIDKKETEEHEGKSKRGFASMPHEQVVEIARKGGQQSHGGKGKEADMETADSGEHEGKSKRGFASMPHEQVVEIARKGGQHSHDNIKPK